jgi:hypothetical protein
MALGVEEPIFHRHRKRNKLPLSAAKPTKKNRIQPEETIAEPH